MTCEASFSLLRQFGTLTLVDFKWLLNTWLNFLGGKSSNLSWFLTFELCFIFSCLFQVTLNWVHCWSIHVSKQELIMKFSLVLNATRDCIDRLIKLFLVIYWLKYIDTRRLRRLNYVRVRHVWAIRITSWIEIRGLIILWFFFRLCYSSCQRSLNLFFCFISTCWLNTSVFLFFFLLQCLLLLIFIYSNCSLYLIFLPFFKLFNQTAYIFT